MQLLTTAAPLKKTLKYTRVIKLQICLKLNLHSTYAVPRSPHERVIFPPKIIKMAQSIQDLFIFTIN